MVATRRMSTDMKGRIDPGRGTFENMKPVLDAGAKRYSAAIFEDAIAGSQEPMNALAQEVRNNNFHQMLHTKVRNGLTKPQVGVSSVWYDGNPCNMHLLQVSELASHHCETHGLMPLRFNSIGVSDGISNGTDGMSYSLQSRDLIADGIETMMASQHYDANLAIPGCDKNMPGCVMAMGRVNRPSVMVYGGTIRAGCRPDQEVR